MQVVDGRGRWFGLALLIPVLVTGCASGPTEEEQQIAEQQSHIDSLTAQINREKEHALQADAEKEVLQAKLAAKDDEVAAVKGSLNSQHAQMSSRDRQIAEERQRAEEYRRRAEQAERELMAAKSAPPQPVARAESRQAPQAAPSREGRGGSSAAGSGKYHLRIISLPKNEPNEKAVQEIAEYLRRQGVDEVVPRSSGNHWVVDIGFFESMRSSGAQALQDKVRTLKFQGVRQFESAYFVTY